MGDLKLKALKYFTVLIALMIYSCSDPQDQTLSTVSKSRISSNEPSVSCKVTSFSIVNLYFDEIKNMPFIYNPNFTGRIGLSFNNNRITQVQGGLRFYPPGGSVSGAFWTNDYTENVFYSGNTITVNSNGMYAKEFVIFGGKIQSQTTTYSNSLSYSNILNYSSGLHQYQYVGNTISEIKDGQIRRIFYMENGNLIKVELFFRYVSNQIYKKIEYLFSDYDLTPNLLKGKFYINGNFFNAFSRNNFRRIEMNTYDLINGEYQIDTSQYAYFQHNIPNDMFIQECN